MRYLSPLRPYTDFGRKQFDGRGFVPAAEPILHKRASPAPAQLHMQGGPAPLWGDPGAPATDIADSQRGRRVKKRPMDILLRLAGLASISVSAVAFWLLWHLAHAGGRHPVTVSELLVALIGFACASAGSLMLFQGRHLFDTVEVSRRWRRH